MYLHFFVRNILSVYFPLLNLSVLQYDIYFHFIFLVFFKEYFGEMMYIARLTVKTIMWKISTAIYYYEFMDQVC